jgi:hypothetical protein
MGFLLKVFKVGHVYKNLSARLKSSIGSHTEVWAGISYFVCLFLSWII